MRFPLAWIIAAVISLSAVTVYFYLQVAAVPVYCDPEPGVYSVQAGTWFVLKAAASRVMLELNVSAGGYHAPFVPVVFVSPGLPDGTVVRAGIPGADGALLNMSGTIYALFYIVNATTGEKVPFCAYMTAVPAGSGTYAVLPRGTDVAGYGDVNWQCGTRLDPVLAGRQTRNEYPVYAGVVRVDEARGLIVADVYVSSGGAGGVIYLQTSAFSLDAGQKMTLSLASARASYWVEGYGSVTAVARELRVVAVRPSASARLNVTAVP